jgi:predicted NodU family carbamoyl transferase
MLTLGINYSQMHDSAACIVRDGELLFAVAEERISRRKHDAGFPKNAIRACLDFAQVRAEQLDEVCFGWQTAGPVFRHDLIGKRTRVPVIMNTSFNLRGEAIVHTPTDAIRTFFSSGMDALVIGSYLVEK